ncbi:bifunctional enoyl-CoA hydratase/phosphate acetyltransferase [Halomonas sp. EGI 63088]|uniref:Bifunctional enoyl-CoA hydratase/phosphate acetyltransferase n=1 Tax=Halomonas flagellata TaxID=2920385 RepID=A0ABS9RRU7_9GAMM|nr:bifunctional enoyl-CoA hydratase/phosphate acetyltransferase [Halomonas flagellata]MCH4562560.1 bifunctional enoyl-CoA hydratase/phosphate acetyltransferase [Halomonas flagellata]
MTKTATPVALATLDDLVQQARGGDPIRVAVVNSAQAAVLETLREAAGMGIAEPVLIGRAAEIVGAAAAIGWDLDPQAMIEADSDVEAAGIGVELVQAGRAEALMKGHLHTDTFLHALLGNGLRQSGRRVSHVFLVDVPDYPRLLAVTDAAVNIAPDLDAKALILQNAIELMHMIGLEQPRAAVISAVETVNPAIVSTLDAACLTLMARRGQIAGAEVDGPLAFDNAISERAAREKGIDSPVAGKADILLMPDLVSGNVLAKNLEYHAGATAAGVVMGLTVPVVLSSRADPPEARLAGLAVAALMYRAGIRLPVPSPGEAESTFCCSPQPESACCPTEVR